VNVLNAPTHERYTFLTLFISKEGQWQSSNLRKKNS